MSIESTLERIATALEAMNENIRIANLYKEVQMGGHVIVNREGDAEVLTAPAPAPAPALEGRNLVPINCTNGFNIFSLSINPPTLVIILPIHDSIFNDKSHFRIGTMCSAK